MEVPSDALYWYEKKLEEEIDEEEEMTEEEIDQAQYENQVNWEIKAAIEDL